MHKERRHITRNGIEIFDYKNPASHGFFISLFLRAGSMNENISGITHFLEHVMIRNVSRVMDDSLYPLLDEYGIEFNASTYSEMVQFYICGASENFDIAADIIARLFSPIILTASEISTERERVKAEIRESDDRTSLTAFTNNIVHEGTTLANPITGTLGGVSGITRSRLEAYRKEVMTADNLFVYVTGGFTDDNINTLVKRLEKCNLCEGMKNENIAPVPQKFGKRDGSAHIKNADFTMLRFSFDMDMSRMSFAETDLIYDMLLGGYSSRFFLEMSERRGLCYDISGMSERYNNIGTFSFSYEVRGGSIYDAAELTVALLSDFKSRLFSDGELMKAGYVRNAHILYDDPRELNFTFAYDNHIIGLGYSCIEERAERYAEITPQRIREVAVALFRPENLTLTIKGNKKKIDVERLESIIKNL